MPLGLQGRIIALIEDDASVVAALLVLKRGSMVAPALLKETDLSLLKAFSYQHWIEPVGMSDISELDALAAKRKALGIVVNDTIHTIRALNLNALVLRPLSGMDGEEVRNERKSFEHLRRSDNP
jgi:adenylyl- and sulfurtransferase ThiI